MAKISIIIPAYLETFHLQQSLNSILSQSLQDIEVICVSSDADGSSAELLKTFQEKDSRVQVLFHSYSHIGEARNYGLCSARGEYVHFLNAEDSVSDYAYEALYCKAHKYDLDVLRFANLVFDVQRGGYVDDTHTTLSHLGAGEYNRLLSLNEGSPVYRISAAPWCGIFRRSFLEERKIRFDNASDDNDWSFYSAVISNAKRMMIARDRLVIHTVNQSGLPAGRREDYPDVLYRSIEVTVKRLQEDGIAAAEQERILRAEFRDVFGWLEEDCKERRAEETHRILSSMLEFIRNYNGPYRAELVWQFRESSRRLSDPDVVRQDLPEFKISHTECACPKVSVVVPIYNVEDYLNEALHSLTTQDLEEMEFMCVNDGSTDASLTILREYAVWDSRIHILDGPNGGYGKAMNRGIYAARGQFLGILEPDDFVPRNMYRELYEIAEKRNAEIVKADFYRFRVNSDGSINKRLEKLTSNKCFYNTIVNPGQETDAFKLAMNTWSGIYRLDFLRRWQIRHNETPGASYQDNGFWFQTFCRAKRIWFVDKPYYMNRRDNPNSSMFSRGKMYCVTEEYRFIRNWLEKDPQLLEKFIKIFYYKEFSNFMVTYKRLAPEFQGEYLIHIRNELEPAMEQGLMDRQLFGNILWQQLNEILKDPQAYGEHICVSVIMPVYNNECYLRETLDCLLARNELQFEVICVDDGSTDHSLSILREYEAKDFRVRVFTQANAGAGAARNHGLQYARGEYLSFLDADDFFEPDMLSRAYQQAHLLQTDITVFRCDNYYEDTGKTEAAQYAIQGELLPSHQPFAGSEIRKDIFKAFVGWAWDKLFRAQFVREQHLRFQEQRTTNDMLFVFSAVVKAERISTMNSVLAHHRRSSGTLSVTREKSWDCFYHALTALREQLVTWDLYEQREQDFINYCLHSILWNLNSLKGPACHKLFEQLKDSWLKDLGITEHDAGYYYHPGEFRQLQTLLQVENAGDYVSARLEKTCIQILEQEKKRENLLARKSAKGEPEPATTRFLKKVAAILPIPVRNLMVNWYRNRRREVI